MTERYFFRLFVGCVALALIVLVGTSTLHAQGADDDWEVIERTTTTRQSTAPVTSHQKQAASPQLPNGTFIACGEAARPAQEPYKSIVAQLNQMWGTHAKVYESVNAMSPHASPGGCIFYNSEFQQQLTSNWMGITDDDELKPILYAINAHELGHIIHGDLEPKRANVPLEQKELEADRFAGYTLWRLNVKRFDAADTEHYYQAVGDDFVGAQNSHGTGTQRTTAFQEGWDLARTGGREDSAQRPAGGLN